MSLAECQHAVAALHSGLPVCLQFTQIRAYCYQFKQIASLPLGKCLLSPIISRLASVLRSPGVLPRPGAAHRGFKIWLFIAALFSALS